MPDNDELLGDEDLQTGLDSYVRQDGILFLPNYIYITTFTDYTFTFIRVMKI